MTVVFRKADIVRCCNHGLAALLDRIVRLGRGQLTSKRTEVLLVLEELFGALRLCLVRLATDKTEILILLLPLLNCLNFLGHQLGAWHLRRGDSWLSIDSLDWSLD